MLSVKDTLRMILSRLKTLTNRSLELPNYFDPDHTSPTLNDARPTTANIEPNSSASVRHFLSTSLMTTGKPATDGNILHFSWDNSNRWATQLAMQHGIDDEGLPSPPQFRYQYGEGKDDWTPWETCGYVPTRQYIYKSGSATVNSANWYNLCSATLPAQSGFQNLKIDEAMKAAQAAAWNDEVVDVAEELLNNQHYKKLQSEIDSEIKDLEFSKNGQSESKIRQIDEQIKKLKEFKNKINRSTVQEVETLEGLYTNLIKFGKWKWFFENIDALTKLVTEESEALHRALNNFDGPELRRVIKELQGNNKLVGITDESINNLISFMGEVKIKRVLKSWEDLVSALKTFLKFAWKLT